MSPTAGNGESSAGDGGRNRGWKRILEREREREREREKERAYERRRRKKGCHKPQGKGKSAVLSLPTLPSLPPPCGYRYDTRIACTCTCCAVVVGCDAYDVICNTAHLSEATEGSWLRRNNWEDDRRCNYKPWPWRRFHDEVALLRRWAVWYFAAAMRRETAGSSRLSFAPPSLPVTEGPGCRRQC